MLPTVDNSKSLADEIVNVNNYFKAANSEQGILDYINSNVELYLLHTSIIDNIFTKDKEVNYSYDYYIKLNTNNTTEVSEHILEALDKLEINFSSTSKVSVAIELPNIDVNVLNLLWSKLSLVITETSDYQIVQEKYKKGETMTEKELDSLLKNVDSLIEEYESKKTELNKEIEAKSIIKNDIKRYETLSVSISSITYDALIKHIENIDKNIVSINTRLKEIKNIITNIPNIQEAAIIKQLNSIITNKNFNYINIKNSFYILNKIETFINTHAKKFKEHDLTEKE